MKYLQNLNNFSNNNMNFSHNNIKRALEIGKEESKDIELEMEIKEDKEEQIIKQPVQEFKQHIAKIIPSEPITELVVKDVESEVESVQKSKINTQPAVQKEEENFENDSSCVLDE